MICLHCGHYVVADREMAREQRSDACRCGCHTLDRARELDLRCCTCQPGDDHPCDVCWRAAYGDFLEEP